VDRGAGANMKSWMQVLDEAINKFDNKTTFVFGHAGTGYEVTGKADDLRAFRDYLGNVLKFVEGEIKAGKSKDEILKASIIPGGEEWKKDGIERPLTAAWEELTTK
jgi:cyclase